jgi:hypothetical protein
MKLNEEQKNKICDLIEKSLGSARLKNHKTDDDDDSLPWLTYYQLKKLSLRGGKKLKT